MNSAIRTRWAATLTASAAMATCSFAAAVAIAQAATSDGGRASSQPRHVPARDAGTVTPRPRHVPAPDAGSTSSRPRHIHRALVRRQRSGARLADAVAPRGARGPAGAVGPEGVVGPVGIQGPVGPPATVDQNVAINWEGSFANAAGRDSQTFVAPGIGYGEVTCNGNTQWIWFEPYSQSSDVSMWTAKFQANQTTVRTAYHTFYTGASFYEGLNRYAGESQSQGSIVGIISSRGTLGGSNGPGPAPTTFRLSWYWNFSDASNPYCFVAGTFKSSGD